MPSYEEVITRAGSLRAMTGLTDQEFQALLPPFEQAFVAYMQAHTLEGQPRTVRRSRPYDTCPLPTMADKLLCMLTYVQQHPIQEVQGQLFGMAQSNTNTWIHLLHAVLNQALAPQELLPARTADNLTVLLATERTKVASGPPLFGMMARSDRCTAQPIPRHSRTTTVASRRATRSKTAS
jgi:Helix-turn-helix of DDE superfamily endonuclease